MALGIAYLRRKNVTQELYGASWITPSTLSEWLDYKMHVLSVVVEILKWSDSRSEWASEQEMK